VQATSISVHVFGHTILLNIATNFVQLGTLIGDTGWRLSGPADFSGYKRCSLLTASAVKSMFKFAVLSAVSSSSSTFD